MKGCDVIPGKNPFIPILLPHCNRDGKTSERRNLSMTTFDIAMPTRPARRKVRVTSVASFEGIGDDK